jgi:hypothetical protein
MNDLGWPNWAGDFTTNNPAHVRVDHPQAQNGEPLAAEGNRL